MVERLAYKNHGETFSTNAAALLYYIWEDDEMIQLALSTALTLLFVTLKLCGVITWPWWSWNPLELSVFILQLYHVTLLMIGGGGYLAFRAARWLRSQE